MFDKVYCINLDSRPESWTRFMSELPNPWPFREVERWPGIQGNKLDPPPWFGGDNMRGAWGCYRSHLGIIERCISSGIQSVLIFEDDAYFKPGGADQAAAWMKTIPHDWGMVYFGGQLYNRTHQPRCINAGVWQPWNVNRMHAYGLQMPFMKRVYEHFTRTRDWHLGDHCDHRVGKLHQRCFLEADSKVLIPTVWFCGQRGHHSDISRKTVDDMSWEWHKEGQKAVVIVGPFRGGTSCVAGIIHKLGISVGNKWATIRGNPKGTYEAIALAQHCRASFKEPTMTPLTTFDARVKGLSDWSTGRGRLFGAKHPSFCMMIPEIERAWPNCMFISVERPVEESIASLRALPNWGWPADVIEPTLRRMVETRDADLAKTTRPVLRVAFKDVVERTNDTITDICRFIGYQPTPEQRAEALAHVENELWHKRSGLTGQGQSPRG